MKNMIIGTAGHIDHGKTSLIKALTGRNTDRWKEEQERGITIDLGFTWIDLPDGNRAGIVDVPGHERFIHNMVAGVVGMDMVLLVIAADDGIMPQTREHMDILGLLGIEKCIIVLNKCDLVDSDWVELMEEEIREEFADTYLKDAPIVKVSSVTGEGLDDLTKAICEMAEKEVKPKETETIPRLPIDRVFSLSGFGTIVTGTLVSGVLHKDDTLEVYPTGKECKSRNIQVHGKNEDECSAGQRCAINISNLKKNELYRGCVLAPIGSMKNTSLLDVKMKILPTTERVLTNGMRLHLFTGTSEILCRAYLLDQEEIKAGEEGFVQLRLEEEIAVRRGDRFVVRFYSPMETIGGGVILEPNPKIKHRFKEAVIEELKRKESGSSADIVEMHAKAHKESMITISEVAKLTALSEAEIKEDALFLEEENRLFLFPMKKDMYLWPCDFANDQKNQLIRLMKISQEKYPYRHGLKKAEVQVTRFKKIKPNVFMSVLDMWESMGELKKDNEYLCTPDFEIRKDALYEKTEKDFMKALQKAGYNFIRYADLPKKAGAEKEQEDIFNLLREENKIYFFSDESCADQSLLETAAEKIKAHVEANPVISIGEVRDMFSTSRKCAKLILEYTDSRKITRKTAVESEWKKN